MDYRTQFGHSREVDYAVTAGNEDTRTSPAVAAGAQADGQVQARAIGGPVSVPLGAWAAQGRWQDLCHGQSRCRSQSRAGQGSSKIGRAGDFEHDARYDRIA